MTLWHIDDFQKLADEVPRPLPWQVVGVLPTQHDYATYGAEAFTATSAFCYTVSEGPTEIWCPLQSIEGRYCPPEIIGEVINVVFTAIGQHELGSGDDIIVPFNASDNTTHDAVFWIGDPEEEPRPHPLPLLRLDQPLGPPHPLVLTRRLGRMSDVCVFCAEVIHGAPARGVIHTAAGPRHSHTECSLREVLGGIGHLIAHQHWCLEQGDPDAGLTYRQSAQLTAAFVEIVGVDTAVSRT